VPTYPLKCECGHRCDVVKSIRFHDTPETCPKCFKPMLMDYGDPGWAKAGAVTFQGHYNHALGQYIGSAQDVTDAKNKIRDNTGSSIVEIGNEKPKQNLVRQEVNMREVAQYAAKLQQDRGETVNA
jgi:predicted nucleic acid-binding Zn ribbon protein